MSNVINRALVAKKKLFLTLAVLVMAICANAQKNQYFWYQGNLMLGNPIAQIDSVTFGEEDTDSILIYLPRTIIKTVYDTVYITIHDTIYPEAIPEGAIAGKFSVSDTKKVRFSQGNLQYQASTQTWRFAENQYDMIGNDNKNISNSYSGWIDLFGWGTGNNPTNSDQNNSNYGPFVDWGVNAISNGGNEANQWRTLTKNELVYLFFTRANAENLFGLGTVNGVKGTIILPDNWVTPKGVSFTPSTSKGMSDPNGRYHYTNDGGNNYSDNTYTMEQWLIMEYAGAVFLPAAGTRNGKEMDKVGTEGRYRSSSLNGESLAYTLDFSQEDLYAKSNHSLFYGQSVRLVQDVE